MMTWDDIHIRFLASSSVNKWGFLFQAQKYFSSQAISWILVSRVRVNTTNHIKGRDLETGHWGYERSTWSWQTALLRTHVCSFRHISLLKISASFIFGHPTEWEAQRTHTVSLSDLMTTELSSSTVIFFPKPLLICLSLLQTDDFLSTPNLRSFKFRIKNLMECAT